MMDQKRLDEIIFHAVKSARGFGEWVMEVEIRPEEAGELLRLASIGLQTETTRNVEQVPMKTYEDCVAEAKATVASWKTQDDNKGESGESR